jgi:hypothetical protein
VDRSRWLSLNSNVKIMGVESILVWGRWWLLGQVVSTLCDIDLYCPYKPQTCPADACLVVTIFPHQTIVGSYFDDEGWNDKEEDEILLGFDLDLGY